MKHHIMKPGHCESAPLEKQSLHHIKVVLRFKDQYFDPGTEGGAEAAARRPDRSAGVIVAF